MSNPDKSAQSWTDSLTDDELLAKLVHTAMYPPPLADLAHGILDGLIESFRDPAYRVEFTASVLAVVPCARAGLRFVPTLLVALVAGKAARWAYESVEEIRVKLGSDAAGDI